MTAVAIVSPGYPEHPGGVTDHSGRLHGSWTGGGHEVDVLRSLDAGPETIVGQWITSGISAALIQYVPFLYGRRGISRFPEDLARAASKRGIRVTTFVHEPWVPATRLSWLVLSPIQRLQLRRLIYASNGTVTPVPRWAEVLGAGTQVIRVGSTLGQPPVIVDSTNPIRRPVVFSPFASGLRWDWVLQAVSAIGKGLTVIGCDRETALHHPVVGRWSRGDWHFCGRLPASEVLANLLRARLVLAPFIDGITGRRTSVMAALSVGAPVLSSTGRLFDPLFADGPLALAGSADEFRRRAVEWWNRTDPILERQARLDWYRHNFDSQVLDRALLQIVTGGPAT